LKVLVIGGGGREHALAWRLTESPSVTDLHVAPGNPGMENIAECHSSSNYVQLAVSLGADLTVVGPEGPLVAGVVDQFRSRGMAIVGPTAENAALEGSKVHSKRFMERVGVPTARFATASNHEEARIALRKFRLPVVLKTDGLAAGKGVTSAKAAEEARAARISLA